MYKVTHLRCNEEKNVIGIVKPVFSWWLESDSKCTEQFRYHIQVALDEQFMEIIWDYQRHTADTTGICYMGPALESRTRYYVRVRSWITADVITDWSETIFFETPIMERSEWKAQWIRPEVTEEHGRKNYRRPFIAEKAFSLGAGKAAGGSQERECATKKSAVKSARLYISALGVYFAELNGKRVSDDYFRPGFTDYNYRVQFQSYDVSEMLADENVLKVTVGEGWFSGYLGWEGRKNTYGSSNALIAQLEIRYEDGSTDRICTDDTWTQKFGEILYSDFYNGESYDCREKERAVGRMKSFPYPKTTLVPQEGPSVRNILQVKPVRIFRDASGNQILDMGQNMVGWLRFQNIHTDSTNDTNDTNHTDGRVIRLTFGEVLDKDGNFYNENLRKADAQDTFVVNPGDGKLYEPHFTFHGFRYVKLEGFTEEAVPEDFTGIVLSSDLEPLCEFRTGNERINRLQSNILWGQRSNFVDIPTDCPQRDERLGWTADAQIILPTAAFDFQVNRFFRKWLRDLKDNQMEQEGAAPYVVPDMIKGAFSDGLSNTTAAWGDAAVICPWVIYETYGDKEILREQYESMKAWIDYIRREGDNEYLWDTGAQLGDWLGMDSEEDSYYGATEGCFAATAYYAYSTGLFAETARILGEMSDYREYKALYEQIVLAFREHFVKDDAELTSNTQTAYVLALKFGLLEKSDERRAAERLAELVRKKDDHLDTGFLGTPYICHVLTEHGYQDLAYTLLFKNDFPSWLYQVDHGATTMWEHWDSEKVDGSFWSTDMNSFNHYAYGSIGSWMYRTIGGIELKAPGFKKVTIAPKPDARIGSAKCAFTSVHGVICCEWRLDGKRLNVKVEVPANTRAFLMLPEPEDAENLRQQIEKETEGRAVYTEGRLQTVTHILYDVEYTESRSRTEKEVEVKGETAFETGSGKYEFEYDMK